MLNVVRTLPVMACLFAAGCVSVLVDSQPQGGKVFMNGDYTGKVTPAEFRVRHLSLGQHHVTVEKPGHRVVENCGEAPDGSQTVRIKISIRKILKTCCVPAFWVPSELTYGDYWKDCAERKFLSRKVKLMFPLEPIPRPAAATAR